MHKVKAVVALAQDAPVTVTTINVPDPGKGEALVKVLTCGVCQTDHHYVTGGVGQDFPYLLGHESAGIVEAVGDDVTNIAPDDLVILNWRAVCGECRACRKGQPQYCFATHNATQKMTLEDGTELTPALGIGSFAEKTLVAAGQCTKITADISPEQYAAIGLLGCGVTAGLGAVLNTGELKRGESVAVIGCGGVGTAAIAGAQLGGATTIIAVDIDEEKLARAREHGATHTVNSSKTPSRPSRNSPAASVQTSSSTLSASPPPSSRPSKHATWLAASSSSACPHPAPHGTSRWMRSSAAAAPSRAHGTATPCPPATSPNSWTSTCSAASIWTASSPSASASKTSTKHSKP